MVVLPSFFTGSPRYMHEKTQDAMTYVRHYGRPDLFITFTCNPRWKEVSNALLFEQKSYVRHDIIARIFHFKVKMLMKLLTKGNLFGEVQCFMYSVEWQKRVRKYPDPEKDSLLYDIIKANMIHRPCGNSNNRSPCMESNSCSKKYPRNFIQETQTGDNGYPKYRRRAPENGGFTVEINGKTLDNCLVVPYNPVLSRTFGAHINVEYCNSVKSIKYICKYITKGSDQAAFGFENDNDEVKLYKSGRYISSSEAVWRILAFPINERSPTVFRLSVHLENGRRVYFNPNDSSRLTDMINNLLKTTLLAFFDLCKTDDFAKTLLYVDVPSYYVWKNNIFERRKRGINVNGWPGIKRDQALGRVYTIHPKNTECYYLRLLLHEVRGPTSFLKLKTVNGTIQPTYQTACKALGLLEDERHWDTTMEEAVLCGSPFKLPELFAIMLIFCQLSDALSLWEKYKDSLSEDIRHRVELDIQPENVNSIINEVYNICLVTLEDTVLSLGGTSLQHYGLPQHIKM
ncbi:ATP-dependent DNA helicase, partial [Aphis craccivora]